MLHTVQQFIKEQSLFTLHDKVLVALSGGADSVALLRVLLQLGYCCEAVHCNFHLRGEESMRDRRFVTALCKRLGIPLTIHSFDTVTYAKERHISIEMAARAQRYQVFEEDRLACDASVVAVAHHSDDSAETFLLNLLRGTGINGLKGIQAKNGHIVRPLLCVSRNDILKFLQEISQEYVTDSTNLHDDYTRNKIRLNLLPVMKEINPDATRHILYTANHLSDALTLYRSAVGEGIARVKRGDDVSIDALLSEPSPHTLLFEMLSPIGFNSAQIDDIFGCCKSSLSGRQFISPTHTVVKDRDRLIVAATAPLPVMSKELSVNGITTYDKLTLQTDLYEKGDGFVVSKEKNMVTLDADKVRGCMVVRGWQPGDRFTPFGMKGSKLVSDYLTDRKYSLLRKQHQTVVCDDNNIIWLVGERADDHYRVTAETKRILKIKLLDGEQ